MDSRIDRTPQAATDLEDIAEYLRQKAGLAVALRFTRNAEAAFTALSLHPQIGVSLDLQEANLPNLRGWHIEGFDDYRIIYRPQEQNVQIIRVLHGARDLPELFQNSS